MPIADLSITITQYCWVTSLEFTKKEATSFQSEKHCFRHTTRHAWEWMRWVRQHCWTCSFEATWSTIISTRHTTWSRRQHSLNQSQTTNSASTCCILVGSRPFVGNTLTRYPAWTKPSVNRLITPRGSRSNVKKWLLWSNSSKGKFPIDKSSPIICISRTPTLTTSWFRSFLRGNWRASIM